MVGGGSLLPLNSQVTHTFTYGQSDSSTKLNLDIGNTLFPQIYQDPRPPISNIILYYNSNDDIYYNDVTKALPKVAQCTQALVDMAGKNINTVYDGNYGTFLVGKGTSPNGCINVINVENGNFYPILKSTGFFESASLNQKFTDTENSTQYGLTVKLKVNSGKAIVGLSSDTKTVYSETLEASETVQTANITWRDLDQKPNRVIIGLVGQAFDVDLYLTQLYRPVASSLSTISIGGSNIDQFTKIIPKEKYFYNPANQSFETKLTNTSDKVAYWKTATTNFDVPPPPPGGQITTTTPGGPPPPPPPPTNPSTTSTTSVSGQGDDGPPAPPPTPGTTSFLFGKVEAQSSIFTSDSINQPRIKINETPDANGVVQGVSDGVRSMHFQGINVTSTTSSYLVDFIYQTLGDNFIENYSKYANFGFELNADIKVIRGKVVAGVANSSDIKSKIKLSNAISQSEQIQHVVLPISARDIERDNFDMIVVGGVQGLVDFYLDNVYLTITDPTYSNNTSYAKYRFSGTPDNLNWDLAKWGNFEKPVGENRIVEINPADDIADGSQFVRVQSALYSEDPYYVPGIESLDLYFTELTTPLVTTTTTSDGITTTTEVGTTTTTTTTEPVIPPINPKTPITEVPFSKLVSTGGVLWVNLLVSMLLSGFLTWLIFRKKKIAPIQQA
ncbi:MAG: hypothetical protein UR93_C0015G0003 [Berkelbacteria bacterium GW2011_GWA2_35_9]|uniref:Uncharacterized protein n=1 Tax=Berkelbacteria bacterium GW2011_GWA2_35_9 TaxID=1618333 RepID=A0A0G0D4Y0_9BACT|nr:MAG: hypothetical protein UR93_C0015G0003 [Berkelbacteria bacterium GW2011_GWA2_35_9]